MSSAPPASPKKRLFGLLRIVVGLTILGFVAWNLPWRDRVKWTGPDEQVVEAEGRILGDWKTDRVRFRLAQPVAGLPSEKWGAAALSEQGVELVRGFDGSRPRWDTGYDWEAGMPRVFGEMEPWPLGSAMALFSVAMLVVVTRWWRLLALAGCRTRWTNAFRLTFLGMFFNQVVPGLTGGDVIKGVIAARENPGRRADALVSVVVDRMLGLGVLAIIGAVVIALSGDTFAELKLPLFALIGGGLVGALVYASPQLRRLLKVDQRLEKLPFGETIKALDRAALLYLKHPLELLVALVFSVTNHLLIILGVFELGRAFGVDEAMVSLLDYMVLVPVANIVSAIPTLPGGWGLGEWIYQQLFEMIGASGAMGVAVSVTFRLCQLVFSLLGGVFLLLPGGKAQVREASSTDVGSRSPSPTT